MAITGTQDIKFNNNTLQTNASALATILTSNIIYNNLPEKVINLKSDTIRDGWDLVDVQYTNKVITISGWLISNTGANLKTLIDNFKGYLRSNESNLDIETYVGSGDYTRWVATTQTILILEEYYTITQKPFTVEFFCQPFGKATSLTSETLGTDETASFSKTITNDGTYKAKPIIVFDITLGTNLTAIKFENDNGDWIQVARTYANGEQLVIDCENETIKVDGVSKDFMGIFPQIEPSENLLDITLSKTNGVKVSTSLTYYQTFL